MADQEIHLRQGLPRVPGGEPWPPAVTVMVSDDVAGAAPLVGASAPAALAAPAEPEAVAAPVDAAVPARAVETPAAAGAETPSAVDESAPAVPSDSAAAVASEAPSGELSAVPVRRGLPRVRGGEPWPPVTEVAAPAALVAADPGASAPASAPSAVSETPAEPVAAEHVPAEPAQAEPAQAETAQAEPAKPQPVAAQPDVSKASAANPSAAKASSQKPASATPAKAAASAGADEMRLGPLHIKPWMAQAAIALIALEIAAAVVVLLTRGLVSLPGVQDFIHRYPGEAPLPSGAPVGIPGWLGWQHFFNVFLMVLIIRSGLQIRNEQRPEAYWTPNREGGKKVSLATWFHQSLDLLWVVNGLVFAVLLFATGQWMRIVPTSWEIFPNALSAALQYLSFDWPTENGWVNYNALQQLAYFVTVFIAAPISALTGWRMSGVWPSGNKKLSEAFPVELARKLHFPTMLYFVLFIVAHVALVFLTGALRNLNHMYAARGSENSAAYATDATGLVFFLISLAVIVGAWFAARPFILAQIAKVFGKVSSR